MRSRVILLVLTALVLTFPTFAIQKGPHRADDPRWIEPATGTIAEEPMLPGEPTAAGQAGQAFVSLHGGEWSFRVDRRTGLATLVQGSGIPTIPGRGNALGAEVLAGLPLVDGEVAPDTLEPLVQRFLGANATLLVPGFGLLELDRNASLTRENGRLASMVYRWLVDGIEVEGARVFVRLNSGNITQFGAPLVGGRLPDTVPTVTADEAVRYVYDWSGDGETARTLDEPTIVLQPEDEAGDLTYRHVWIVRYRVPGRTESWEGRVDAVTGEIVGFRDINHYGRVTGGVYERTVTDPEIVVPFPLTGVTLESGSVTTDDAGYFLYQGGVASSGLDSPLFTTSCSDGCTGPPQALSRIDLGAGMIDFGTGGIDGVGNGLSTKAERNAYWHINRVRLVAKRWLPTLSWLDASIGVNVNIDDTCNAFWNGSSANFYRSGGGCNNTGEVADVVQHEWGHGIDGNTQGGDGATGEGTADVVAIHMSHDPVIGPYFRTTGSGVRNVDKDTSSRGLMTRTNVSTKCPPGSGAQGRQVHCEGEIYGQTAWDLAMALAAKHGNHTGWRTSERIFYTALPDSGSYLPTGVAPIYNAYLNADDDDGNLSNGTPNGQEIFDAFDTHEIAGADVGSSPACTRPSEVSVSAVSDCDRIDLSWDAVVGIDQYEIVRADVRLDGPFYSLGTVPAGQTSYVDTAVAPGVDYWYSVIAVATDGCESTIESPVFARLDDQPVLSVSAAVDDDVPRGNRSGFADPGEEVDLRISVRNYGTVEATSISGVLTSLSPGVTVLDGNSSWPSIPVGGTGENESVLRFVTNEGEVTCGDRLDFVLVPDEATACSTDDSYISVVLGTRQAEYADDFETDTGWTLDTVNSTAVAGNWTYGDPRGTTYQPDNDSSPDPGRNCWYTAPNPTGDGDGDVDDGITILLSPVLDLSGLDRALLSYDRWFAQRDLGDDPGDFFTADVSSDGGATWLNLETLGPNETAGSWTRKEFDLEDFIVLTSQVQLRFQASEATGEGDLLEAAVDEVRIEQPVCDDTPACYTEPSFAGLETAQAGASCGEVMLSWQPATTNCVNAEITYSVYRDTVAGFEPGDGNRIATGLTGSSLEDSLLDPGVTYFYVVRAFDSRSGEDSNVLEHAVVSPVSPDTKAPVFSGLVTAMSGTGCGETVLTWSAALESCNTPVSFEVYRSTDPAFVPSPANRIGSSLTSSFVDAALVPGVSYTYLVRARDGAGNEDVNDVRLGVTATILDELLQNETFDPEIAAWSVVAPNDALAGQWELGDPVGTGYQSEDDHTADPGVNAWITGLATDASNGDIDDGTTTLLSARYDVAATVDPAVVYHRWFTNDRGAAPGEDPFVIEVSNDDGATWTLLEQVGAGTPLDWVRVQIPLTGIVTPTADMRFRFTASDTVNGSLVEAGIDDFSIIDLDQGCLGCATPVGTVGTVLVNRSGDDVVLDWTGDPVMAARFVVYKLLGPDFGEAVRIGSTEGRTFVHEGAALADEDYRYRVTAVDPCGNESALQ